MFVILYTKGRQKRYATADGRSNTKETLKRLLTSPEISEKSITVLDPETMERGYTVAEFNSDKEWNPLVAVYCTDEECPRYRDGLCTADAISVSNNTTDC